MPKAASLRNLRPWSPGQSGNPKGRPRAPRFTEREQHEMRAALAGILGGRTQREAVKAMGAVLTNPRTALQALKFCGQVTGELAAGPGRRRRTRTTAARPVTITWNTS